MRDNAAFRKAQEAIAHLNQPAPPWKEILTTARDLLGADAARLSFLAFDLRQSRCEEIQQSDHSHLRARELLPLPAFGRR